jgi:serine-type D-Ala-D-Ala carboxypeptidase (penicillin-binding protein 5/6)
VAPRYGNPRAQSTQRGRLSILRDVLIPSRVAAGSRLTLLAVLLFLLAALAPDAPSHARPVRAAAPESYPVPVAPLATREPPDLSDQRALRPLREPIRFEDATARFRGAPAMLASSGILVDIDTNQVLWSLTPHDQRAPASTAKMIASIVAMENFPPNQVVVVQPQATAVLSVETRMGLVPGERLTVRELLSGMLTVSANDAALAIPYGTVGMPQYVAAMNEEVDALGLSDSHFTGPVGFPDDPRMVSSAYDLAAIATAAYRNYPLFRELTSSHDIYLPASPNHHEYKLHNINRLMDIYPAAIGTKSGFTDIAGPCLVSMAVRDNHHIVAVLLNAPKMFDQSRTLLEWGFTREGLPAMYPPLPTTAPARGRR